MFSAQMPRGGFGLALAGLDQRAIAAMANIFGQCQSNFRHDGALQQYGPATFYDDLRSKGPAWFERPVIFGHPSPGKPDAPVTFWDNVTFGGTVTLPPDTISSLMPFEIELTTDLFGNSGVADAKRVVGGVTVGDAFEVEDSAKLAWNAFTGQRGFAINDGGTYRVISMNAPVVRRGTIDDALPRPGLFVTFTDTNEPTIEFPLYGNYVLEDTDSSWQVPADVADVMAVWHQAEDSGNGIWILGQESKCLEAVV